MVSNGCQCRYKVQQCPTASNLQENTEIAGPKDSTCHSRLVLQIYFFRFMPFTTYACFTTYCWPSWILSMSLPINYCYPLKRQLGFIFGRYHTASSLDQVIPQLFTCLHIHDILCNIIYYLIIILRSSVVNSILLTLILGL